jgi:hypothetical protein
MIRIVCTIVLSVFLLAPQPSNAAVLLDQSNLHTYSAMVGTSHYQQQFTVGITGLLDHIDLYTGIGRTEIRIKKGVSVQTAGPWIFDQSITFAGGVSHIDLSALNIAVATGDRFVIDWVGGTGSPVLSVSAPFGPDPYNYPGGDLWGLINGSWTTSIYGGTWDMLFQTFVNDPPDPTPEPVTLVLVGSGLAGMAFLRRRKTA